MIELNFNIGWYSDDHCTDVRGVAVFETNMTWEEWHSHEGEKPMEMKNIKLDSLEIPFKKLIEKEDRWEWRKADSDEIDYLVNHPDFREELYSYWMERTDDE